MPNLVSNWGYILKEVRTILRQNGLSSLLSVISLTLIFFVAILAATSWQLSTGLVRALENEAEISVYYEIGRAHV